MASPITFLSDFDGVWTNPWRELQEVHRTVQRELQRLSGWSSSRVEASYASFRQAVLANPEGHGWHLDGSFSSYVDEDYFAVPTSVGQYIERAPCEESSALKQAVLQEYPTVLGFLDECYHNTCARFRQQVEHDLVDGAAEVLTQLLEQNVQVVFATNAPAEKVVDWFAPLGFVVKDAQSTAPGSHPLRVYGRAGKQFLGASGEQLDFGGRMVHIDRPQYRAILEREAPDLVVGDVLSLDLALPVAMRLANHPAAPCALGVMELEHTPQWVRDSVDASRIDYLLPHVSAVAAIIEDIRES